METALSLLFLTLLLGVNHKWAGVDPHNVDEGPSWIGAIIGALLITAILFVSTVADSAGYPQLASFLGSYAFGAGIAPSISTPSRLKREEEPSWLMRKLEA